MKKYDIYFPPDTWHLDQEALSTCTKFDYLSIIPWCLFFSFYQVGNMDINGNYYDCEFILWLKYDKVKKLFLLWVFIIVRVYFLCFRLLQWSVLMWQVVACNIFWQNIMFPEWSHLCFYAIAVSWKHFLNPKGATIFESEGGMGYF